jgi:hypothetical protein
MLILVPSKLAAASVPTEADSNVNSAKSPSNAVAESITSLNFCFDSKSPYSLSSPSLAVRMYSVPSTDATAIASGMRIVLKPGLYSSTHASSFTVSMPSVPPVALQSLSGRAWMAVAVAEATSMVMMAEFSWQLA